MQGCLLGDQLFLPRGADQPSTRAEGPLQGKTHGRSVHLRGAAGQISILKIWPGKGESKYFEIYRPGGTNKGGPNLSCDCTSLRLDTLLYYMLSTGINLKGE